MKVIFIAGSWGSGTTAVIGALSKLGVPTLGPHFGSNDPNTQNTFELMQFRDLILRYVDQPTLKHKDNYSEEFIPALKKFQVQIMNDTWPDQPDNEKNTIALKMPLASICLPEICSTFDAEVIVVHRPFDEIEASRLRRNWPPLFGSAGAHYIYGKMFSDLVSHKLSFLGISYDDVVNNTRQSLIKIAEYCDIDNFHENLGDAVSFVRKP